MNNLDYGVIGNCRTAALVSKTGSINWLCFPDFDSPAIFAKLLEDKIGGNFAIQVPDGYSVTQEYLPNTNILVTRFASPEGAFNVVDYMPRYKTMEHKHYLPSEVHRYIRLLHGKPKLRILYNPRMNYAKNEVKHSKFTDYIKTESVANDEDKIYLYTSIDFDTVLNSSEFTLHNDEFLMLSYNQKVIKVDIKRIHLDYERTKVYWLDWSNRSRNFKDYNQMITRSMLILKLMSYHESGAMLAALTTSLPETIGEVRNWDYRFCWVRDASMTIDTLLFMGHKDAAQRFIGFLKKILKSRGDTYQIMYGIRGEKELTEEILPHLSGYENSVPVRVGNAAYKQIQNDSLGYLMDVIFQYYRYFPGTLDEVEDIWEMVRNIVREVMKSWQTPDQSIWEFRTRELHFVFSKVMSWVAMDRAASIAEMLNKTQYAHHWRHEAERIRHEVFDRGWSEATQCFRQAYENEDYDSSLLLMQTYGFIDAHDTRFIKTVKALKENLLHNGLMYRYKSNDDFGVPSSAFTICTFWLIEALHAIGEHDEALQLFQEISSYANHLGLFSEDLDFETKRQLGNFPQAYSHLAFINTASLFSEEEKLSRFIQP